MSEFNNQSVADLAWAISSPPLVTNLSASCVWPGSEWFQQLYRESLPWLQTLDEDPAELEELLDAQKDRRLGKYFETLWYYWLEQHPRYDIIETNLQIIIDGETLGEMDFIVFDKVTQQTLHWEVAVKFYLGTADGDSMSDWLGPNGRDRLDRKVEHLLQRQSIIGQQPRVAQWLKRRGIKIDACLVIMKGRLYYPWRENVSLDGLSPIECASDHLRGWWFNRQQFEQVFDDEQYFIALINEGWMERIPTSSVKKSYVKKELFETISNKKMRLPLHVNVCDPCRSWDRVFITDVDWPLKKL